MNLTRPISTVLLGALLASQGCASTTKDDETPEVVRPVVPDDLTVNGVATPVVDGKYTIVAAGTYRLAGTVHDGVIEVNAAGRVELELCGLSVTHSDGPAIHFIAASEAVVTLVEGTVNELADGMANSRDAALLSAPSLTIRGAGSLVVTGKMLEGITTKQDFRMEGGRVRIVAVEDGINASNDGKGASTVTISGGYLHVAVGGDGIDSNGAIVISGAETKVIALGAASNKGEGLDCKSNLTIEGGTVVSTGDASHCPLAAASPQPALLVSGSYDANTLVCIDGLLGSTGALLAFLSPREYDKLFFSSADVKVGQTYEVRSGGDARGSEPDGLFPAGTECTGGTVVATVDTTSTDI